MLTARFISCMNYPGVTRRVTRSVSASIRQHTSAYASIRQHTPARHPQRGDLTLPSTQNIAVGTLVAAYTTAPCSTPPHTPHTSTHTTTRTPHAQTHNPHTNIPPHTQTLSVTSDPYSDAYFRNADVKQQQNSSKAAVKQQ
jgi:hypothetical protein